MAELYKEEYGYEYVPPTMEEQQRRDIYQSHSYGRPALMCSYPVVGAYVSAPPPHQQYQVPRAEPPQLDPSLVALLTKFEEKVDEVVTKIAEVKVKVADVEERIEAKVRRVSMLPDETLSPREQEKAITMDPPPSIHERAEATKATEEEMSEEIPVPTVDPPSKDTVGRSEEKQWPLEQSHEHVPVPSYVESTQGYHEDACSMSESDKLIEQVVHEIELLGGKEKAQVFGVRQERKATKHKKPRGSKSGPRGRYKDRHSMMKGAMAASRKMKPSTPCNTTKVKMKAKRGVGKNKGPRQEGKKTGHGIPKMAYLKYIGRKDQFPPPFIP